MINNLARQFIASFTIIGLLLPSLMSAEILPPDFVGPPAPGQTIAPLPSLTPPASGQKSPAQRLAESRKEDQKQCEAEVKGGGGAGSILGQTPGEAVAETLKGAVEKEIGKAMPQAVNQILNNDLAPQFASDLRKEMPDIITTGLKKQFPQQLMTNISDLEKSSGLTFDQIIHDQSVAGRGRFTGLIRESIDESLPAIITDGLHERLPKIIDGSLQVVVPHALRVKFNQIAKPTIESHFRAQIDSMIAQIPQLVVGEIKNLQATIQGTISGLQGAIKSLLTGSPTDMIINALAALTTLGMTGSPSDALNSIPQIAQINALIKNLMEQITATKNFFDWANGIIKNKEALTENLVNGFSVSLSQSLTNPKAVARLADAIGNAMTDPINRSLDSAVDRIAGSLVGPISNAIDGVNKIPQLFFDPINQALNGVADIVDLELNTVVQAVTDPITAVIDGVSSDISTTINSALTGILSPVVGEAQGLAGGLGTTIASGISWGAVEVHTTLFGSDSLFTDLTTGEPLSPNGPSTYLPTTETGIMGPPAPGEVFIPAETAVPPLADAADELATTAETDVTKTTPGVVDGALNETTALGGDTAQTALTGSLDLSKAMSASIAGGAGAILAGVPIAGPILAPMVTKWVSQALAGTAFGATAAALAVPVTEIGALLAVNQSTDQTTSKIYQTSQEIKGLTEKIYSLQVQACTHLKVVRRVQLALEEKELLNDPNAFKANAEALHEAQLDFINNFLNQGRQISEGINEVSDPNGLNKSSLIGNYDGDLNDATREAKGVFQAQLKDLESDTENYPYAKIVRESLLAQDNEDPLRGTLSKTQIDKFRDNPESLSNDEFWNTFVGLGDPRNNPYGSAMIAQGIQDQKVAAAQAAAAAEYQAGGGYLGTRECIAQTADGFCAAWRTLTPGSTIGYQTNKLIAAPLEQTIAHGDIMNDSTKSEGALSAARLRNLSNVSETVPKYSDMATKQSIFAGPDPCPGPGPCPQTGWPRQSSRPSTSGGGSGNSGGLGGLPIINNPPSVAFGIDPTSPTVTQIEAGAKNETILRWASSNTTTCQAGNDWVSGSPPTGRGNNVKNAGDNLGTSGSVTIVGPVTFQRPIFSQLDPVTSLFIPATATTFDLTGNLLKYKFTFNPLTVAAGVHPDDTYRLTFYGADEQTFVLDVGGPGSNPDATAAQVIKLFNDRVSLGKEENSPLGEELRKYSFAQIGDNALAMSPLLVYKITCATAAGQSIDQELSLTRKMQ